MLNRPKFEREREATNLGSWSMELVGGYDLEALIALWGTDSPAADVDEDATVGPRDLAL